MNCRLCLQRKDLCKSHIYPEFMYKNTYDDARKINVLQIDHYKKRISSGFYERLLCNDCEQKINKNYEEYGNHIIYNRIIPKFVSRKNGSIIEDYDYKRFKLFMISLLWRSSISSLDFFKPCKLGRYEEELRQALKDDKYLEPQYFPIIIGYCLDKGDFQKGLFTKMSRKQRVADGKTFYNCIIDGLHVIFMIGKLSDKSFVHGGSVREDMLAIGHSELDQIEDFRKLFQAIGHQHP